MKKVNIESKNVLARLMATENISVQHQKVQTASFDVKNRVLNLPMWESMDDTMYEGLIGHEVGHALYTPFEEWRDFVKDNPNLKDYANVIEDARIEKKMKLKFPGMNKTFFKMYDELNFRDFFGIKGKDISTYGILDRINLHFKLGVRAEVTFNEEETIFVNRVAAAETFEEVLALTLELGEYAKNEDLNTDFDDMDFNAGDEDGDDEDGEEYGSSLDSENEENEETEETDGDTTGPDGDDGEDDEENDSEPTSSEGADGDQKLPPESKTQKNFDDSMGNLNDENAKTPIYVDLPNVDVKSATIGYKKVSSLLNEFYSLSTSHGYWKDEQEANQKKVEEEIKSWKKDTLSVVNYMVKEFEMKQAATAHRRTSVGKTGVLDTNKMHAYKFEDDIFKRVAAVQDGRNHALSIYVDWSGSMQDKMFATVKQTLTLVMFARKVGIPFRVYAFSNSSAAIRNAEGKFYENNALKNFGSNHLQLRNLALIEFFNEKMSANEFKKMIDNFYKVGLSNDWNNNSVSTCDGFHLASTPLNECIIASYEQVAQFKRETQKEKVNVIFLTDGASDGNDSYFDAKESTNKYGYRGWGSDQEYLIIKDPKTKKVICDSSEYRNITSDLLRGLKKRCDVNVIGFFITNARQVKYEIESAYRYDESQIALKAARKNGYASLDSKGYDKYFVVNDKSMDKESEFQEVNKKDDGTVNKSKLRTAFKKFSKGRKVNKMLLNEFVAMVA